MFKNYHVLNIEDAPKHTSQCLRAVRMSKVENIYLQDKNDKISLRNRHRSDRHVANDFQVSGLGP